MKTMILALSLALLITACATDDVVLAPDTQAGDQLKHEYLVHTVTRTGRIQHRFGGRVVMIDAVWPPGTRTAWPPSRSGPTGE